MREDPGIFERFSTKATRVAGSTLAFTVSLAIVAIWGITGPFFRWSDTWQLVINTGTTIVTFLMVFLIQRAQNKDSKAIHLKLGAIIKALPEASNALIDAEDHPEREISGLRRELTDRSS